MLRHFTCHIRIPHPRLPLETCIIQPIYPDELITLQITAIHVTCTYVFTQGEQERTMKERASGERRCNADVVTAGVSVARLKSASNL